MRAADKIEPKKVSDLIPYEKNSRAHTEAQIQQLSNAINEWGFTIPILVDDQNVVLAGHARLQAAKSLGMESVPCIVADGWSDEQKRAYVIADNKLAENSTWDTGLYFAELKELSESGFDLTLAGFDENMSFSYEPNLQPMTSYQDITANDIDSAAERVGTITPSTQKVTDVICPHCGEEFEFSGI